MKDIDKFIDELNKDFNLGLTKEEMLKAKKKALEDIDSEYDDNKPKDKRSRTSSKKTPSDK